MPEEYNKRKKLSNLLLVVGLAGLVMSGITFANLSSKEDGLSKKVSMVTGAIGIPSGLGSIGIGYFLRRKEKYQA